MEEAIQKLKKIKARKIFVQFPEGLTLRIQDIIKELEKNGFEVILCLERCFGACDVRENEARLLGCDAILHIGHEKFLDTKFPVVYWEYFIEEDAIHTLEKEIDKLKDYKKIGLVTSIQFVKMVPDIKYFLEKNGKETFAYKSLQYPGQILGCNLEAAKKIENKVDCFLCISAGDFYADGIVLITEKPVFVLDLEKKEIRSLEDFKRKIQKIIAWNKDRLKDVRRIGLLVSWKKGQFKPNFFELKSRLEKEGKEVYVLAFDEIAPEKMEGLKLDLLINCGCPRISIDDLAKYKLPILNAEDI
jgi:2-(3-amino-3-carboxypropyl)histidine synthase